MKTSELQGKALDWAVAKCEGLRVEFNHHYNDEKLFEGWWQCGPNHWQPLQGYSTDWAHGGPIIEREGISICNLKANSSGVEGWTASTGELWSPQDDGWVSKTPLIAAMRCYVASKLGDEVEVPVELTTEEV
jgi:hypothetical protein